jgi:hypothetical protein
MNHPHAARLLVLALRLLHTPAGSARRSPCYEKELAHEQ